VRHDGIANNERQGLIQYLLAGDLGGECLLRDSEPLTPGW
jgi:hypothetical protein